MSMEYQTFAFKKGADTTQVQMSMGDIIHALRHDAEFFIQFFLGEELDLPIPGFHKDCWRLLTAADIFFVALALPRGYAKTTLMKLACVYHYLFTDIRFAVYLSNTLPIASEACVDIIKFMRSDNFAKVFGPPVFTVNQDTRGFYKFQITIPSLTGAQAKNCVLRALGAGQQVRGINVDNTRPELACVDDLEDDENTATDGRQKHIKSWFFGVFLKAMTKKLPRVLYSGNMLSNKSILYHIVEKDPLWHSMRFGCLRSDGTPLWAELQSLEDIKQDFIRFQKLGLTARWFAEMMNMPMAEGQGLINSEDIPYAEIILPGQHEAAFITLDPATSKKTWANDSALVVHVLLDGVWRIGDYITGKYKPDELFFLIVHLCLKWRTRAVGIEGVNYQSVLKMVFELMMVSNNQTFNVYEIPHRNKPKTERLIAWCSLLRKKHWVLQEGDFAVTEQLLAYDPLKENNVDDLIDACAMGPTMTQLYMADIMDFYTIDKVMYVSKIGYAACAN